MLDPTPQDMAKLEEWPMIGDPRASIHSFRQRHLWMRWIKPANLYMHLVYNRRRSGQMAQSHVDMQEYWKQARIPLERYKWEYLKLRKSWYIVPLHWDRFGAPEVTRILDVGCGDGDVIQRIVTAIEKEWEASGLSHPIEIVGIDLSESRIDNARRLCAASRGEIQLSFVTGDAVADIPFPDGSFDYALCNGVLENLSDEAAAGLASNMCRVVKKGIYIEDLADRYPEGFPRDDLGPLFEPHGFTVVDHYTELTEPFSLVSIPDPCYKEMSWPIQKIQIVWLERS